MVWWLQPAFLRAWCPRPRASSSNLEGRPSLIDTVRPRHAADGSGTRLIPALNVCFSRRQLSPQGRRRALANSRRTRSLSARRQAGGLRGLELASFDEAALTQRLRSHWPALTDS